MSIIKFTGPQFTANSTTLPSTVPTNAVNGSNAGSSANIAGPDFTGYGNATAGGATCMYVFNPLTTAANVAVSNGYVNSTVTGTQIGLLTMAANSYLIITKYAYEVVNSNTTANLVFTPIAFRSP